MWKGDPRHVFDMSFEFFETTVRTHIDNFDLLLMGVNLMIEGCQVVSSEGQAAREVVGTEEEAQEVTRLL
jgi:FtsZ-binding cell division protein ZapB